MTQYQTTANRLTRDLLCIQCREIYSPFFNVCCCCLFNDIHAICRRDPFTPDERSRFNQCFKNLFNLWRRTDVWYDEMRAFGAPGECYDDVGKTIEREYQAVLTKWGFTELQWQRALRESGYAKLAWKWGV